MLNENDKKTNICEAPTISGVFVKGIIGSNDKIIFNEIPQIAFIGRSNVGKSSIINALVNKAGFAKSSSKPGKTREINFFLINENIYFVDLPGYGYAKIKPKDGIKLRKRIIWYFSNEKIKPKFVVLIIDSRIGISKLDYEMLDILGEENHRVLIVVNKTDKLSKRELNNSEKNIREDLEDYNKIIKDVILFSSKTKFGREKLLELLIK